MGVQNELKWCRRPALGLSSATQELCDPRQCLHFWSLISPFFTKLGHSEFNVMPTDIKAFVRCQTQCTHERFFSSPTSCPHILLPSPLSPPLSDSNVLLSPKSTLPLYTANSRFTKGRKGLQDGLGLSHMA